MDAHIPRLSISPSLSIYLSFSLVMLGYSLFERPCGRKHRALPLRWRTPCQCLFSTFSIPCSLCYFLLHIFYWLPFLFLYSLLISLLCPRASIWTSLAPRSFLVLGNYIGRLMTRPCSKFLGHLFFWSFSFSAFVSCSPSLSSFFWCCCLLPHYLSEFSVFLCLSINQYTSFTLFLYTLYRVSFFFLSFF